MTPAAIDCIRDGIRVRRRRRLTTSASSSVIITTLAIVSLLCDVAVASGASLAEPSRRLDGSDGWRVGNIKSKNNNCGGRNISDVESKCLLAPIVFEGSVQMTGHWSDRGGWINARLQVNVVHKGELEDNSVVNVGFVGGDDDEDDDEGDRCKFRRDIFEVGKKYVVFAARDLMDSVVDTTTTTKAPPRHGLSVFSEPVLRTKRSSRIVRKTLCTGCAKPPSISGLKDITVRNNSKVQLKCKAKGNPAPEITWYKDDYPVTETENVVINKTKLTSKLTIKKVGKDNTGQYKCRATSVYGEPAFSKGNLKIRSRPTKRPTTTLGPDQSRPCGGYNEYCLNGGTCFFYETLGEYVCQCAEGYKGRRCESKDIYHLGSM